MSLQIFSPCEKKSVLAACEKKFFSENFSQCGAAHNTTLNNGYLGSRIDEERSERRYLVWSAFSRESSNFWTHSVPFGASRRPRACLFECQLHYTSSSSLFLFFFLYLFFPLWRKKLIWKKEKNVGDWLGLNSDINALLSEFFRPCSGSLEAAGIWIFFYKNPLLGCVRGDSRVFVNFGLY